jgi:hypothetical protein
MNHLNKRLAPQKYATFKRANTRGTGDCRVLWPARIAFTFALALTLAIAFVL